MTQDDFNTLCDWMADHDDHGTLSVWIDGAPGQHRVELVARREHTVGGQFRRKALTSTTYRLYTPREGSWDACHDRHGVFYDWLMAWRESRQPHPAPS